MYRKTTFVLPSRLSEQVSVVAAGALARAKIKGKLSRSLFSVRTESPMLEQPVLETSRHSKPYTLQACSPDSEPKLQSEECCLVNS